jgi:mono/diheme cytochrome c family protein
MESTVSGSLRASALALLLLLPGCGGAEVDGDVLATLPTPSEHARGAALYAQHCSVCHGAYGLGAETGPPLVHPVYRPRHHGDEAFQLAVAQGVRAHHWRFGDMSPVPGLDRNDVAQVTGYVRWLQRAVGVD